MCSHSPRLAASGPTAATQALATDGPDSAKKEIRLPARETNAQLR